MSSENLKDRPCQKTTPPPATEAKAEAAQASDAKPEATSTAKASDELSEVAGGSMAPEGQPVLPAADHHTALAIAGGVVIAALGGGPSRAADRYVRFLLLARDIAAGGAGRMAPEEN